MKLLVTLQIKDIESNERIEADSDEVADLVEAAICDIGPVKININSNSRSVVFVEVEVLPKI